MKKILELLKIYFLDRIRRPLMVAVSLVFGLGFFVFLYFVFETGGLDFGGSENFGALFAASYLVFLPAYIAIYGVMYGLMEDREKGMLKAYRSSRLTKTEYFAAKISAASISSLVVSGIALGMIYGFTGLELNAGLVLLAVLMTVLSHAGIAFIATALSGERQESQMVMQLFVIVLIFGTPVFYPETLLPESVRMLQNAIPLTHSIELVRGMAQGTASPGFIIEKFGVLSAFSAVLMGIAYRVFRF